MIFHTNTTPEELILWLRYSAIAGGMPTQFIDAVDKLDYLTTFESEVEKVGKKLSDAKDDIADLYKELGALVGALERYGEDPCKDTRAVVESYVKSANKVLERHADD